jgi:hypothetical protein
LPWKDTAEAVPAGAVKPLRAYAAAVLVSSLMTMSGAVVPQVVKAPTAFTSWMLAFTGAEPTLPPVAVT